MRRELVVDRQACTGHGLCYGNAPDLVEPDEKGYPVILFGEVPEDQLDGAELVVDLCPERALSLRTL